MRSRPERCGFPALVVASIVGLWTGAAAAGPIQATIAYGTSGEIGTNGIDGTNIVRFQGIESGSLTTPTPTERGKFTFPVPDGHGARVPLGEFLVELPQSGAVTSYEDTPFAIKFHVSSVNGATPGKETDDVVIRGTLNGLVSSTGTGNLTATIDSVIDPGPPWFPRYSSGSFLAGELRHILTTPDLMLSLAPSMTRDGRTPVTAVLVSAQPVPEPSTLAVFLAASAGLWGWRRFRSQAENKRQTEVNPMS